MEILTFNEFQTLRVIESEWYDESDKQLSFHIEMKIWKSMMDFVLSLQ